MRTIRGNEKKGNLVSREKELQISSKTTQFLSFMDLLKTFINKATIIGIFYFLYKMVAIATLNLSGKSTLAQIVLKLEFIWPLATLGAGTWAYTERTLRKKQIKTFSSENRELRNLLDSNAQSSLLDSRGNNRMEDR